MALYELHRAVRQGDLARVNELLGRASDPSDINRPDDHRRTPIMYALVAPPERLDVLRTLIRHGAWIVQEAVSLALNDLQKLNVLLDAGADILYTTADGYDALINAACRTDARSNLQLLDILRFLIGKGVALRGMSEWGESAVRVFSRRGRFDAVQLLLEAGANPDDVKLTPLIKAVAFGTLADVATEIDKGANLEEREHWGRTAWLVAIQTGDIAKAKLLLERGADRDARGRCERPPLFYAIEDKRIPMLNWLLELGINVEQADEFGTTPLRIAVECCNEEAVEILLRAGANVHSESRTGTALEYARTRNIAVKLLEAGADPKNLRYAGRRAILGYPPQPDRDLLVSVSRDADFASHRSRRPGVSNPEELTNPFWVGMIRSGVNAYCAGQTFEAGDHSAGGPAPVWCAERFGQSLTFLPDGRVVQVAGEHEDYYDPDFCIYNDVFVHSAAGGITIYGYPESVFPPTDFHTATLVGPFIYLIGSLGYPEGRRDGVTPVYRLDTTTFEIVPLETTGEVPGWIHGHRAVQSGPSEIRISGGKVWFLKDGAAAVAPNATVFILDVGTRVWRAEPGGT